MLGLADGRNVKLFWAVALLVAGALLLVHSVPRLSFSSGLTPASFAGADRTFSLHYIAMVEHAERHRAMIAAAGGFMAIAVGTALVTRKRRPRDTVRLAQAAVAIVAGFLMYFILWSAAEAIPFNGLGHTVRSHPASSSP